jgi:FKBP-type peptidyl-prolyl cis-trans isomerase FkpA
MKRFLISFLFSCLVISMQAQAQPGYLRTPKGAAYRILTRSAAPKLKTDDIVTFNVTQKTDRDSVLFSSYQLGHPVQIRVQASQNVADMMEIFAQLAPGDSVLVKIPADSVFKNGMEAQRPPFLPKGSNINYIIKVLKAQSLVEARAEATAALDKLKQGETTETAKYIAARKLAVRATPSGLKYVITRPSNARKPVNGDTLQVNYTGRLLSGKVFDSSIAADAQAGGVFQAGRPYEPIEFVLGQGRVIPGWDEGLLLMNQGAKGTFIIPSNLAYGGQGQGDIPPFSTLVFDIELVKIKPQKRVAPKPTGTKTAPAHATIRKNVRKN